MKKNTGEFNRHSLKQSFYNAFHGIHHVVRYERNMRIHIAIAISVVILGVILHLSRPEWIMIILCMGIVFSAEILNTAVEKLVDLISPEKKDLAGKVKDIAAGAVFISALTALAIGLIIFVPYLL